MIVAFMWNDAARLIEPGFCYWVGLVENNLDVVRREWALGSGLRTRCKQMVCAFYNDRAIKNVAFKIRLKEGNGTSNLLKKFMKTSLCYFVQGL